jgi:hypothetical protein
MSVAGGTSGVVAGGLTLMASLPPPPPQADMPTAKRQAKSEAKREDVKEADRGLAQKLKFWVLLV